MPTLSGSLLIIKYMAKANKTAKKKAPVKKDLPAKKKAVVKRKAARAPASSRKGQQLPAISMDVSTRFMHGVQDLLKEHGLHEKFEVLNLQLGARGEADPCGCIPPQRARFILDENGN